MLVALMLFVSDRLRRNGSVHGVIVVFSLVESRWSLQTSSANMRRERLTTIAQIAVGFAFDATATLLYVPFGGEGLGHAN